MWSTLLMQTFRPPALISESLGAQQLPGIQARSRARKPPEQDRHRVGKRDGVGRIGRRSA